MSVAWTCRRCLARIAPQSRRRPLGLRSASSAATGHQDDTPTVSPFLLDRAKASVAEHTTLSSKLADAYDTATAKRIGELVSVTDALKAYNEADASLSELNQLLHDPSSDAELRSLANDDLSSATAQLQTASRSLAEALIPKHPFAHLPCLVEIRPGVGGNEAALFASDLLRMYTLYCSRNSLRATLLKYEAADGMSDPAGDAPMAEAILEVNAPGAYGKLRGEAGVHRVQRVPATESKGRTHTSAASVMVLPSFPETPQDGEENFEDPSSDYYVHTPDVRVDVMRARGAGGQHVNTTDSAVRLTHIPTGTVVAMQDSRSQLQNRQKAWVLLRAKLAQARRDAREEESQNLRRRSAAGMGKSNRSDKVRTYNWSQQRVTDHRSGFGSAGSLGSVMNGEEALEEVIDSVNKWLVQRDIEDLAAEEEVKRMDADARKR